MKNIGDILRKTREEKGYSLVDMQRETKLQQRYLSALENNQLDSLPGDIYYDSFVRQYAQALGLDGDDLLADREAQLSVMMEYTAPPEIGKRKTAGLMSLLIMKRSVRRRLKNSWSP